MSKLQELADRKEELVTKVAQLWDELIEVEEYISVIKAKTDKKPQLEPQDTTINLRKMELNLRDAALRRASKLFSETLSALEEVRPECPNCGEIMKKKINEPNR
jgi:hypothetical protein